MIEITPFASSMQIAVLNLILSIQRDEFGFEISAEDQPDLLRVPDFYQWGTGNFWVALAADQVVGTIALRDMGNHESALRKMFVARSHRGGGYGVAAKLLQTLLVFSERQGTRDVYLGTTDKFLAAHRFYEKNRFIRIAPEALPTSFPRMGLDTRFYRRSIDPRGACV